MEILGYARKATGDEENRQETRDKSAAVEDKLIKSTEQLEKSAKCLEAAAAEIQVKIAVVTSMTSQLKIMVNSYKDALLKAPTQLAHPGHRQGGTDPAIGRSVDRKTRQVLIDFMDDQMSALSEMAVKEKILDSIKQISFPLSPKNVAIKEVTKLRNNGIVVLFNTKEVADWLQNTEIELIFTASLAMGASIRPRQHIILVLKIPTTLDSNCEVHLREIEEINQLKDHSISKIRWIKPENRCKPDQQLVHTSFTLSSVKAANICIRDGILIHGVKTYPSKMKQEPMQCLKCRKWGHYANQCMATRDTYGTCRGNHWTKSCNEPTTRFCASCNTNSHTS
jgi:hypothetical protein